MALNDILLQLDCYTEPTRPAAVDWAVDFTARIGGKVSALAVEVKIPAPTNWAAERLIGISDLARAEEAKSRQAANELLAHFEARARGAGVFQDRLHHLAHYVDVTEHTVTVARTRDLTIVPVASRIDGQASVADGLIFGSGRPVLVAQTSADQSPPSGRLDHVVVAWDGGRPAARALADALPILAHAKEVRVLTILNEKPVTVAGAGAEAVRHLQAHGIPALLDEVDAEGARIGKVLERYLKAQSADLLVMGAFGHSRLREFILGGATQSMLESAPAPIMLAH
ncbi:universal stress protein [Phenylobacterium sp.]|uniref:universal stress protein n=1 Tax=Phenylobacterium sp. TaxID=1871053 RepID=UPI002899278C|nr:universal stress protein [Phenylobacterium sp.]